MSNDLPQSKEALPGPAEVGSSADELAHAQKQLKKLNLLFDVALSNMARGLSVFDADQRLIVCNRRYGEIYALPESVTRPGTPFASIAGFLEPHDGSSEAEGESAWIESHVSKLAHGETVSYDQHLKDGRNVHVTSQPLTDGGWVDIHELWTRDAKRSRASNGSAITTR